MGYHAPGGKSFEDKHKKALQHANRGGPVGDRAADQPGRRTKMGGGATRQHAAAATAHRAKAGFTHGAEALHQTPSQKKAARQEERRYAERTKGYHDPEAAKRERLAAERQLGAAGGLGGQAQQRAEREAAQLAKKQLLEKKLKAAGISPELAALQRQELARLNKLAVRALRAEARALGVAEEVLTEAIEGERAKPDLIKLVFKNTTWESPGPEPEPEPEPQTQPAAAEMMSMPEAEGPEADAAWRALVATNPNGTVIDDFMIALPSDGTAQQGTEAGASATATET